MMASEAFIVDHPEGYDEQDVEVFRASVTEALKAITNDAHQDVCFQRTWRSMADAGLGDHNSGNWQGEE